MPPIPFFHTSLILPPPEHISGRKKVKARKNIVIEKGFVQARIRKFMISSEVCEKGGKVNNKRRLERTHGDNMKSASKRRKEE